MKSDELISGTTTICGVIGDPIAHTMSPSMHNAAFKACGLDYIYLPFRVKKDELGRAIAGMRALNIRGLNVTIPHKVAIRQFIDKLDDMAEKIGAVNTLVNENGIVSGYNTDAQGFLQALLERDIDPAGKTVSILGAGGAARAISFILAERGANLIILNRTPEKAGECAGRIAQYFGREARAMALNNQNLKAAIKETDILVNTTSLGMSPDVQQTPVTADLLQCGTVVFDTVYNPLQTRLLMEAEKAGAKTISGIDMLVWQGALAFEKWTGQQAPVDAMRTAAIKRLTER